MATDHAGQRATLSAIGYIVGRSSLRVAVGVAGTAATASTQEATLAASTAASARLMAASCECSQRQQSHRDDCTFHGSNSFPS